MFYHTYRKMVILPVKKLPGVYATTKKDGSTYYRASFTYKNKHISLGSFSSYELAGKAYVEACELTTGDKGIGDYDPDNCFLSFAKWVCIINYRDNNMYIKTPIYMQDRLFRYYYDVHDYYIFDVDDLFYYSEHSITRRGGHLFVNEYGMQTNIMSRYGIHNYAVCGRDYIHMNGNNRDYRYSNIQIINRYFGVFRQTDTGSECYLAKIHTNGDYIIGRYDDETTAAIAYNKAADYVNAAGISKDYQRNYIEDMTREQYMEIYTKIRLSKNLIKYCRTVS